MNFGNYVYDDDNDIEELLLEEITPPPITRQRAYNNLYNINDNYQFVEVNLESHVYRTVELHSEIIPTITLTSAKSEEYSNSYDSNNNNNNKLPRVKRIRTI